MSMLLGFAPFVAFAVLSRFGATLAGLWVAGLIALGIMARSFVPPRRSVKILEAGSAILFLALAVVATVAGADIPLFALRLVVDIGLFVIAAGSIAIGRPFTLQYAKEMVAPEVQANPRFRAVNTRISAVWALAFAIDVACAATLLWLPQAPRGAVLAVNILAFVGAVKFTTDYPARVRARAAERGVSS